MEKGYTWQQRWPVQFGEWWVWMQFNLSTGFTGLRLYINPTTFSSPTQKKLEVSERGLDMEIVVNLWNILLFLFFFSYPFLLLNRQKKKASQQRCYKLPPGSMGWPCIGETPKLYSEDPSAFFASRLKRFRSYCSFNSFCMGCFVLVRNADAWFVLFRYGEISKTHILGCPCVILAAPEAIRFVLGTRARFFKPTYPKSKMKLIGPSALFFHQGKYHAWLRKLVHTSLSADSIRRLVPGIESLAISALDSLAGEQVVLNTFHAMKKVCFVSARPITVT